MPTSRHRIDSTEEAVRIMRGAHKNIVPPPEVPLDAGDEPFFRSIIDEFAKVDWTPHQVQLAAMLARAMNDFVAESAILREEGAIIMGSVGTPIPNPRRQIIQTHASNILSFRRTLALHAAANGKVDKLTTRLTIAKEVEGEGEIGPSDLIARH